MTEHAPDSITGWIKALEQGGKADLARAITAVENDYPEAQDILQAAGGLVGRAIVVGVTGPPGAGKSTLVDAYVGELRRRGTTAAVLAVDPSSPLSGGALLGDRIRMRDHAGDPGVFVRSLASRGRPGGLALSTCAVVDLMDAAGFEVVIVETVGVGQSEIEIAGIADVRILVCVPGAGDDIQAAKAGILEIADVIVVNKADLPQADATEAVLRSAASYRAASPPRVLTTVATTGAGLEALVDAAGRCAEAAARHRGTGAERRVRHQIVMSTLALVRDGAEEHRELPALGDAVRTGAMGVGEAARRLLAALLRTRC